MVKIHYKEFELRLDEVNDEERPYRKVNHRYVSTTDPEAGIIRRGKAKLCYQTHRAVDEKREVITAVKTTAGDVNEAHSMQELIEEHQKNTEKTV